MKTRFLSLAAASLLLLAACGDGNPNDVTNSDTTASGTTGAATTTTTSTGDYAAMADSFAINSEAGHYLNPATGKSGRITMDRTTGRKTWADNNEPVERYIDRRTWWVYDDEGTQLSRARMENDQLYFEDAGDKWVTYDKKIWISDEDQMKHEVEKDGDTKTKYGEDKKVKTEKDGDVKIRSGDTKIKKDEDGVKVKEKDQ